MAVSIGQEQRSVLGIAHGESYSDHPSPLGEIRARSNKVFEQTACKEKPLPPTNEARHFCMHP
jgi:hypothetical protein